MAFNYSISFATALAANFSCNPFRIMPDSDIVSKLLHQPSEVAVLFDLNLSRLPFLGHIVPFNLLLFTGFNSEHAVLFLCHIFTQRSTTHCKMEWRSLLWPAETAAYLAMPCVCARQSYPSIGVQVVQERGPNLAPKSLAIDFWSQTPGIAFGSEWEMTGRD